MSNCLLAHGYFAHDTGERHSVTGARLFELRRPDGSHVAFYHASMLEKVLPEMDQKVEEDRRG